MRDVPPALIRAFARLGEADQRAFLRDIGPREVLRLDAMFESWAHEGQLPPSSEGWRTWLMMAGRGFGKTRAGAEWVHQLAMAAPQRRIALVGASLDEARSVMVEGKSGLIAVAKRHEVPIRFEPSINRLRWPNGSEAFLYSGDSGETLRGPEHHFAWCDELAKWRSPDESWDNLQLGLRLGPRPRALVTTTPRALPLLRRIRASDHTVETGGATGDNINLPQRFVDLMLETYGGTRLGRQELDGELMAEAEGALFPRALLERQRVIPAPSAFDKVVVAVDPPTSSRGDQCGIIAAGRRDGRYYVLADMSLAGASPERWARVVDRTAAAWDAALIIAEGNQGGEMVTSVLRAAGCARRIELVHARVGKVARAEPVATRFEAGTAFLAGIFPELEAELSGLTMGGGYEGPTRSPDRADAMVWALSALATVDAAVPRVRVL